MSHSLLQEYWWLIISVVGGLLVFQFFVQGGQSLIWQLGKTEAEKSLMVNALGKKWELGFTTMVLFGGAFFAAFPLFYATSFGGAYFLWMAILLTYILQAVSYEYRTKKGNFLGQRTFEFFLHFHGFLSPFLIGVVVASFFSGSDFSLNIYRQVTWQGSHLGLELLASGFNLLLGLVMVILARVLGGLFLLNTLDLGPIHRRTKKVVLYHAVALVILLCSWLLWLFLRSGVQVNSTDGSMIVVAAKYWHNIIGLGFFGLPLLVTGVAFVLWGVGNTCCDTRLKGFWPVAAGSFLLVVEVFFLAGYSDSAFYPSTSHLPSSLTIYNASSSYFTLKVMTWVSFFIPVVLGYIAYVWSQLSKGHLNEAELQEQVEKY